MTTDNQYMNRADHTRRAELSLAWVVTGCVLFTGIYDFNTGSKPLGVFRVDPDLSLVVFIVGAALTALLATALRLTLEGPRRPLIRLALLAASFLPVLFADPTYASLMVLIPLVDIRRRDSEPTRSVWVFGALAAVAAVLLTEDTPGTRNGTETLLVLAIAFLVVILLGDALRDLDNGLKVESQVAQLIERSRLAEEMHDSLGHHLLATSVQLQTAQALRHSDPERADVAVGYAAEAVKEALVETRLMVETTRSDERFAVEPSIRELVRRIVPTDTAIDIDISGDHESLDAPTQIAIYRVVQEALTNLVRHSAASAASIVSTATPERVTLDIIDNGDGFVMNPSPTLGGISNMRRRVEELGGAFEIASSDAGTNVNAWVPR